MDGDPVKCWHIQADTEQIYERYIHPTLDSIRSTLNAGSFDVYSYSIPLREDKGIYHILFCRCPTRKQNPFMRDIKQRIGLSCWPELIYGDVLILYSKQSQFLLSSYLEGGLACSGYTSIPIEKGNDAIACMNKYKITNDLHPISVRSQEFNPPIQQIRQSTSPRQSSRTPVKSTCPSSTTTPSSFLLKMALKGLLAEKATCPITLEKLSQYKEVQMFVCGHACSPQERKLTQCPVCRANVDFVRIPVVNQSI